jgi:hypothetical protein
MIGQKVGEDNTHILRGGYDHYDGHFIVTLWRYPRFSKRLDAVLASLEARLIP